jgi:hypothetical protein
MFLRLLKLQVLKNLRSVSLGRKVISGLILGFLGLFLLLNVLAVGFGLPTIINEILGRQDVLTVINTYLIFFFFLEMMYRFFLQKGSVIELKHFLHLPIGRSKIIHSLLVRSFISPFNIIGVLLFAPVYWMEARGVYGSGAFLWLFTILGISWSLHWVMLLFKQKYGDSAIGILMLFGIYMGGVGSAWYGWFNAGEWAAPFFDAALQSPLPACTGAAVFLTSYLLVFWHYKNHAYIEELDKREDSSLSVNTGTFFNRMGMSGDIADAELKLILRHKKSRMYLLFSMLFLAYGLFFYFDGSFGIGEGVPWSSIFVGTFITGLFIMNYGQLFLSWNSPYFDFFLAQRYGVRSLIQGKYLLFFAISLASFILALPYVYFGWNILFVHTATFLFNMGVNIHIIIYMALWKPKPMDLDKSNMFNYEGMGAAQFLMGIPMLGLPYIVYLPIALLVNEFLGLIVLGAIGFIGIIFSRELALMQVQRVMRDRYAISSSFRQEL